MSTVSKYALVFQNRLLSFDQDIELIDIICRAQKADDFLKDDNLLFSYLDDKKHPALNTRKANTTSRGIVINHLKATVYSSYIKDIYEELTAYIKSFLYEAALKAKDPCTAKRLLGDQKITINAADALTYNTLDDLIMMIAESIIQGLEHERSTKELVRKICSKTSITIDDKKLEEALPFLELRHKLVHTDGKVDSEFKNKFPQFTYDKDDYITLNHKTILAAKSKITSLVLAIDKEAIKIGLLLPNT